MFLLPRHFAKSPRKTLWQKNWIVAEPKAAPRRKNKLTKNLALKALRLSVRKGEGEGAHEMGFYRRAGIRGLQRVFDFFHGRAEIPCGSCPARGIYARSAFERRDA